MTTLTNSGVYSDIFVVKYDSSGNVVWAKSASGTSLDEGYSITVDANGNSYVTGYFYSPTITFDTATLTSSGGGDIFIVKYDASGNVVWVKSAGGTYYDYGQSIAVDANGNSYVTGIFGSSTITFGSTTLTNSGDYDVYIVKYDASGNVVWAKSAGGTNEDKGYGIAVDAIGNSYVTGWFSSSTITFGSTTLTNSGSDDIFVVKYDSSGNVMRAKSAGGTSNDLGYGIAVDASGNSYVTGYFSSSTITFRARRLLNNGGYDVFVAKIGHSDQYRTFPADTSLSALAVKLQYSKGALKSPPNIATAIENVFKNISNVKKVGAPFLGIPQTDKNAAKKYAWVVYKEASKGNELGQLYTAIHTQGNARPLDSLRIEGKKTIKLAKAITPSVKKKYNNTALEQGVAFNLNLLASNYLITPPDFGNLILDTAVVLAGRNLYGVKLTDVGKYFDSVMTYWDTLGVKNPDAYANLNDFVEKILRRINNGFAAPMDLTNYGIDIAEVTRKKNKNPYAVYLGGVKKASDVGIVREDTSAGKSSNLLQTSIIANTPSAFALQQNYPNPFNPTTTIRFAVSGLGLVSLKVFDVLGREVATLLNNEAMEAGTHEVTFDANRLTSGVYFYRITVGEFSETKKLLLMK